MSEYKKGMKVKFKGYAADTPEDEQVLAEDGEYTIEEVEKTKEGTTLVVRADNPNFDPDVAESKKNQRTILVDVFSDEVDIVADKPAKGKGKAVAATKAPRGRTKAAKEDTKEAAEEEVEELENEDEEVVKLIEDSDNVLELAQELSEEGAALDYKLGGVLYHIRKDKSYVKLDKKYAENGGFGLYVKEHLNTEYRKAMYLIDIYVAFNKFGIDAAKVAELGWTKASKIAAVMTEENAEELVELAGESTVSDLVDTIKESYKEVGRKAGDRKKMITFKFRLFEDQADATSRILSGAAEQLGLKRLDDAFEHIVIEWGVEHGLIKKKDVPARPVEEEKEEAAPAKAKAKPAKAAAPAKKAAAKAPPPAKAGKRIAPRRAAR